MPTTILFEQDKIHTHELSMKIVLQTQSMDKINNQILENKYPQGIIKPYDATNEDVSPAAFVRGALMFQLY